MGIILQDMGDVKPKEGILQHPIQVVGILALNHIKDEHSNYIIEQIIGE